MAQDGGWEVGRLVTGRVEKQVGEAPWLGDCSWSQWDTSSEEGPHSKRSVLASKHTAVPGSRACGRVSRQCGTKTCPSASETQRLSASPAVMGNSWSIQLT